MANKVAKAPVFADSFTLSAIDLSNSGSNGNPTTLDGVIKQVKAKYKNKVKIKASGNKNDRQTTFDIQADSQKELDETKRSLVALCSPIVTLVIDAPLSTISSIIGRKGATINQIRDQTNVRIVIPSRQSRPNDSTTHNIGHEDETTVPITLVGPQPHVYEAQALINKIISSNNLKATVRDIPAHILPFVLARKALLISEHPKGRVNLTFDTSVREITVSGERERVTHVADLIKQTIRTLEISLTSLKISLPKGQRDLIRGDAIMAESKCTVVPGKVDEYGDSEVIIWGQSTDIPAGFSAVVKMANSQYIQTKKGSSKYTHQLILPGPVTLSKLLTSYLKHVDYGKTIKASHPKVDVSFPSPSAATPSYVIGITGSKGDVEAVIKQFSDLLCKIICSIRDVNVEQVFQSIIIDKYNEELKQLYQLHNVLVYFPDQSPTESDIVVLIYDPLTPIASALPDEKQKHFDEVEKLIIKWCSEMITPASDGEGVALYSILAEDTALSIKGGAEAGDPGYSDANNNETVDGYSMNIDIDKDYVVNIVGSPGIGVNELHDQPSVNLDGSDNFDETKEEYFGEKKAPARTIIYKFNGQRALAKQRSSYNETVSFCRVLFSGLKATNRINLYTADPKICQGEETLILDESWDDVAAEIETITVMICEE